MEETRKYSKFEWFFYLVLIPLLFTAIIAGVILQFMGFNVTGKAAALARQTPVINKLAPADRTAQSDNHVQQNLQKQIDDLTAQLQKEKANEAALQSSVAAKTSESENLKAQLDQLRQELAKKQSDADSLAAQVKTFTQMAPEKAAVLIAALPDDQAAQILKSLKSSVEAAILEKMDPTRAAALIK